MNSCLGIGASQTPETARQPELTRATVPRSSPDANRRKAVHPGADRRDAGRPQGTGRLHHGARKSAQDWRDLLLELKQAGSTCRRSLTIADGALGFWKAAGGEVWPQTREQRVGCTRPRTYSPSCRRTTPPTSISSAVVTV